ncbi:melanoma antigen preferentially expressed in tumors-like [Zalophus californianus]|uniref:Melanoma antigen preferentially expressed in tumors-like n=1 Tax=Zalophus californianus TaxID=9704 RepID=A0A6J2B921_ZALCA|nr:melanoma antigen preferentially expressed in tumors-like [Zalophus californianus]
MSIEAPPRLLELAGKSLLKDKALAIAALEYLPSELFPPLFMVAFAGRYNKTLKAMVCAWPFAHLPLGGLMQTPHQAILQAAISGLGVLLAQKVRPRRWKLQVLDLRNTGQNFWRVWSGARAHVYPLMGPVAKDGVRMRQPLAPLVVSIDLCLRGRTQDECLTYLLRWATQRSSLHLCCKKLKIFTMAIQNIKKVLNMVQLDSILEVEVNCTWKLSTLEMFAPYLGQMSNVRRLVCSHIHATPSKEEKQHVTQFTSQFLQLHHLQKLSMDSPSFLEGCLDQMLR